MNGYYPETDEEFYSAISNNLQELIYTKHFKISPLEKKKLWITIYETAQRYEEQKQIDLKGATEKFVAAFKEMFYGFADLISSVEDNIPLLQETIVNMRLANRSIKETNEVIERIKQEQGDLERKLIGLLKEKGYSHEDIQAMYNKINERKNTVEQILKDMTGQSNQNGISR